MAKKKLVGTVVSKAEKSAGIVVAYRVRHPRFFKTINRRSKFIAHDEENKCVIGDQVEIIETKPISKTKSWIINRIIK